MDVTKLKILSFFFVLFCFFINGRCDDDDNPYRILPSDPKFQVSVEKAKGLGISFLPFEVTLKDTIESLKEKGFLNI